MHSNKTAQPAQSRSSGFTLIELLVVIAIIGMLAAVVMTSLGIARAKARDAHRLSDLVGLRTALELYATDHAGLYPSTSSNWRGNCSAYGSYGLTGSTGWIPDLAPKYLPVLPVDPSPPVAANCYVYKSDGTDYMLMAYGTVETYTSSNNPEPRPAYPTELDFALYSPGAKAW